MFVITIQAIVQGLMMGMIYAALAVGLNVVFSCTHLLNFAHGHFVVFGMYICFILFRLFGFDPYLSMFISSVVLFGIGFVLFRYVLRRLLGINTITAVQVTIGLILVIESFLHIGFTSEPQTIPTVGELKHIDIWLFRLRMPLIIAFLICSAQIGAFHWILYHTGFGRSIRAIVDDPITSNLMGINVLKVQTVVFAFGFLTLGFAGAALIPLFSFEPTTGMEYSMLAFMVVVVGGMGSFLGTLIAGLIVGVVNSLGLIFLGGFLGTAVLYGLFVFLLVAKPTGLMGLGMSR